MARVVPSDQAKIESLQMVRRSLGIGVLGVFRASNTLFAALRAFFTGVASSYGGL